MIDLPNLIIWVIVGGAAGWLASTVMGMKKGSLLGYILLGVVGGVVGNFVLSVIGIYGRVSGLNLASIFVAFIGSIVLLFIVRSLNR